MTSKFSLTEAAMETKSYRALFILAVAVVAAALLVSLGTPAGAQTSISFQKSLLKSEISTSPTSLQFGPDGRLYVAQQNGLIYAYTIERSGFFIYDATAT